MRVKPDTFKSLRAPPLGLALSEVGFHHIPLAFPQRGGNAP
jgi:hypothetical protein